MKSTFEILQKIRELSGPSGATRAALLTQLLPYQHARRFLKPGVTRAQWKEVRIPASDANALRVLRLRQPEVWGAANARNNAHVSICFEQFELLLWFLGMDHEEAHWRMWDRFEHYGKPQLAWLAETYDLGDWREWDDGQWHMSVLKASLPAEDALAPWRKRLQPFVTKSPDSRPPSDPEAPSMSSSTP